jgi:hypothetical protein
MHRETKAVRTFRENLESHAEKARSWRLAGDHHEDTEFPLIGKCFDNALVARTLLEKVGYEPIFVEGTTERVADPLTQYGTDAKELDSVTDLAGHVHYWLQLDLVEADDEPWVVDIASDTEHHLGEIVVGPLAELDEYITYPDSKAEGEKAYRTAMEETARCRYCADLKYRPGGCPQCYVPP